MNETSSSSPVLPAPTPGCTIHSLYDDILSAIFLCCNQGRLSRSNIRQYGFLSEFLSPWVLSYVCSRWRALVISSPLLWTTIDLNIAALLPYPSPFRGAFRLETSLQRSQNLDLFVRIHDVEQVELEYVTSERHAVCFQTIVPLLLPTIARWRHLEIFAFGDIFEAFEGQLFGRLRSLTVWQKEVDSDFLTLFQHTPLLTELTVEGEAKLDLQWGGIRTFTAARCEVPEVLPRMVALQALHLVDARMDVDLLPSSFDLPELRAITMQAYHSSSILADLSKRLNAPALETFELIICHPWGRPSMSLPIFNTTDKFIKLSIDYHLYKTTETVAFLARLPSITTLYLGPEAATPDVIEAIGLSALPRLTKLCLHFSTMQTSAEHVVSMLECRTRRPVSAIAEISFARFRPSDVLGDTSRESGFTLLSKDELGLVEELRERWRALRTNLDVHFVERYSFD